MGKTFYRCIMERRLKKEPEGNLGEEWNKFDIKEGPRSKKQIEEVVKDIKINKAAGSSNITTKLIKVHMETGTQTIRYSKKSMDEDLRSEEWA